MYIFPWRKSSNFLFGLRNKHEVSLSGYAVSMVRILETVPSNFIEQSSSLKMKLWNQYLIQGRLVKTSQTLIWNFPICMGDMVKAPFGVIFVLKTQQYLSMSAKEKNGKIKYELRVTSSNPRVTSSNLRVTSFNSRVRTLKARVARLKARVGRLKARVRWSNETTS